MKPCKSSLPEVPTCHYIRCATFSEVRTCSVRTHANFFGGRNTSLWASTFLVCRFLKSENSSFDECCKSNLMSKKPLDVWVLRMCYDLLKRGQAISKMSQKWHKVTGFSIPPVLLTTSVATLWGLYLRMTSTSTDRRKLRKSAWLETAQELQTKVFASKTPRLELKHFKSLPISCFLLSFNLDRDFATWNSSLLVALHDYLQSGHLSAQIDSDRSAESDEKLRSLLFLDYFHL